MDPRRAFTIWYWNCTCSRHGSRRSGRRSNAPLPISVIARKLLSNCDPLDVVNPQDVLTYELQALDLAIEILLQENGLKDSEVILEETVQGISVCVGSAPNQLCRTGQV